MPKIWSNSDWIISKWFTVRKNKRGENIKNESKKVREKKYSRLASKQAMKTVGYGCVAQNEL